MPVKPTSCVVINSGVVVGSPVSLTMTLNLTKMRHNASRHSTVKITKAFSVTSPGGSWQHTSVENDLCSPGARAIAGSKFKSAALNCPCGSRARKIESGRAPLLTTLHTIFHCPSAPSRCADCCSKEICGAAASRCTTPSPIAACLRRGALAAPPSATCH
jgi:hypothetical protein